MSDQRDLGIGQLITTSRKRDAIHVAIIPVTAGELMEPGAKVTMDRAGRAVLAGDCNMGIGYVDPQLQAPVEPGDAFWLFLHHGTIRTLRHEWTSDVFPVPDSVSASDITIITAPPAERAASEEWLREFAKDNFNPNRETAESYYATLLTGDCPAVHTETTARELNDGELGEELRKHIENVSGKRMQIWRGMFTCWC